MKQAVQERSSVATAAVCAVPQVTKNEHVFGRTFARSDAVASQGVYAVNPGVPLSDALQEIAYLFDCLGGLALTMSEAVTGCGQSTEQLAHAVVRLAEQGQALADAAAAGVQS